MLALLVLALVGADARRPSGSPAFAEPLGATQHETLVRGRVADATPEVTNKDIDVEALARFIKSRKAIVQACYEKELRKTPTLAGKVVMRFTITQKGRTSDIEAVESTLPTKDVATCLKTVIRGWVLPFKPEVDAQVKYPFDFSPVRD